MGWVPASQTEYPEGESCFIDILGLGITLYLNFYYGKRTHRIALEFAEPKYEFYFEDDILLYPEIEVRQIPDLGNLLSVLMSTPEEDWWTVSLEDNTVF